jgi:uncharacterized protein DUF4190
MGYRFNPPPGWPPPPEGWVPAPGWQPDPAWPPVPDGWQLWVPDDTVPTVPGPGGFPGGTGGAPGAGGWRVPTQGMPGQPPYPYGGQYPYAPGGLPSERANGAAIASLILGLFGFIPPAVVASVVLGIVALVQIRNRPQRGRGLAIAGLVLSAGWLVLWVALIALAVAAPPSGGS